MINFNESGFIGLSTSNAVECNPYALTDYGLLVLFVTLIQKYMTKVKMGDFFESVFMGLSTSNAVECNP